VRKELLDRNPFDRYPIPRGQHKKRAYLTLEELKKLREHTYKEATTKSAVLFFVLSTEFNGVRASDLLQLRPKNIRGSIVEYVTQKNKVHRTASLTQRAQEIIAAFGEGRTNAPFLLPFLPDDFDSLTPDKKRKALESKVTLLNRWLARAAKEAGIEKHISTHLARHTVATLLWRKGTDRRMAANALGDKTERMMDHYIAELEAEELRRITEGLLD
jgi:site-specific recombinase XerD